jgi:hypothetical protein
VTRLFTSGSGSAALRPAAAIARIIGTHRLRSMFVVCPLSEPARSRGRRRRFWSALFRQSTELVRSPSPPREDSDRVYLGVDQALHDSAILGRPVTGNRSSACALQRYVRAIVLAGGVTRRGRLRGLGTGDWPTRPWCVKSIGARMTHNGGMGPPPGSPNHEDMTYGCGAACARFSDRAGN